MFKGLPKEKDLKTSKVNNEDMKILNKFKNDVLKNKLLSSDRTKSASIKGGLPIDHEINKRKKKKAKSPDVMYDGKPYRRKWPLGWGSKLDIRRCPDFGNVEKVYRVMTKEDKILMKNYIMFLERDLMNVRTDVIVGDSFLDEQLNDEEFESNE